MTGAVIPVGGATSPSTGNTRSSLGNSSETGRRIPRHPPGRVREHLRCKASGSCHANSHISYMCFFPLPADGKTGPGSRRLHREQLRIDACFQLRQTGRTEKGMRKGRERTETTFDRLILYSQHYNNGQSQ